MIILKKCAGIIGLLLCVVLKTQAQRPVDDRHYPDSLSKLLRISVSDTARANLLYALSDYWSDKDTIKALQYARHGLQLSNKDNFYTGLGHFYLAGVYFEYNTLKSQREYMLAEKLLSTYKTRQSFIYQSKLWHNYGVLEQYKDNSRAFADILLNKCIPLAILGGDSIKVAADYMDLGLLLMNYKEYKKAISYYDQALGLLHHSKILYTELAYCYTNKAKAYVLSGSYQMARPYIDSAFKVLLFNPESSYLPACYCVEGMYYNRTGKYKNALNSLNNGLKLAEKLNRPYDVTSLLYEKYETFKAQKNYPAAKRILLRLYNRQLQVSISKNAQEILYELAQTDAALGNTKAAYQWMMQHSKLTDSINSVKTQTEITALETKFQNARKEKEILKLQNDRNTELQKQRYDKLFYFSTIILLCLGCILTFIQLHNRKKIALKNEAQYRNEIKRIQQEKQLATYTAIMDGQEQERQRLARDLHDGLGGLLAGVKMDISRIIDRPDAKTDRCEQLRIVTTQLDGSVNELRRIARNLMPETLFKFGLIAALKDFCEGLESKQTHIVFQSYGMNDHIINDKSQIMIYRIIQELVTNSLKHARAKSILVDCICNNNQINITVEDDGIGFDPEHVSGTGIGLTNIKARVSFLNGKLTFQSVPDTGTTIIIEFKENGDKAANITADS